MIRRQWFRHTAAAGLVLATGSPALGPSRARVSDPVPLFALRNPGCPCCLGWAEHLRGDGFDVLLHESPDLQAVKDRLGIPEDLRSCHTAVVEGFLVEGHVPGEFVRRLVENAPGIAGIAVAGMPAGSPGMEGPNPEPFEVIAFGSNDPHDRYVYGTVTPT